MLSIAAKRICPFAHSSIALLSLPISKPSTISSTNNLSFFTRSSQSAEKNSDKNEKLAEENITKEDIERLIAQHKVKMLSMPVRSEFLKKTPLTTKDLESIDIHVYHRKPEKISDYVAYFSVKFLRFFADAFFRRRYIHRAIVLETVAGVPGMVAGMLCHMKCQKYFLLKFIVQFSIGPFAECNATMDGWKNCCTKRRMSECI